MTSALFIASTLAFIGLIAINAAQARSSPADRFGLKISRTLATQPPPYMVVHWSKSKESTSNYQKYLTSPPPTTSGCDQGTMSSPSKPASPRGELDIEPPCSNEESPCINDGCISVITDFGRPIPGSPSPPKPAPPIVPVLHPNSPPRQYLVSSGIHHDDLLIIQQVLALAV